MPFRRRQPKRAILSAFNGALAEVYFAPGQYLYFSIASNRRKFISRTGKPVHLGTTGMLPTGTAPLVYHHLDDAEAVANFATNRGTGGNFTITGNTIWVAIVVGRAGTSAAFAREAGSVSGRREGRHGSYDTPRTSVRHVSRFTGGARQGKSLPPPREIPHKRPRGNRGRTRAHLRTGIQGVPV